MSTKHEEIIWEKDDSVMALIPEGEFLMGSAEATGIDGLDTGYPQHKVYLNAYFIDKYEVTNQQFAKFLNDWGKDTDEDGQKMISEYDLGVEKKGGIWQASPGYEKHPVVQVTWFGANQYAIWAGKWLPTEAGWEKACRAGSTSTYCFGDDESILEEYAWYTTNSGAKTHPVGTRKPNQWGIYDMHGNVWEWCSDWYDKDYYKSSSPKNPQGPNSGNYCVMRGGSWYGSVKNCRSAARYWWGPESEWSGGGFRCAQTLVLNRTSQKIAACHILINLIYVLSEILRGIIMEKKKVFYVDRENSKTFPYILEGLRGKFNVDTAFDLSLKVKETIDHRAQCGEKYDVLISHVPFCDLSKFKGRNMPPSELFNETYRESLGILRSIKKEHPYLHIIAYTGADNDKYVRAIFKAEGKIDRVIWKSGYNEIEKDIKILIETCEGLLLKNAEQ